MLLAACKTTPQNNASSYIPLSDESVLAGSTTGKFTILTVKAEGDKLVMEVEYTGKADDSAFLTWNGMLMKSLPPKASVQPGYIISSPSGKTVRRTLTFDISRLRENTRKQGLVILIDGFDKPISIPAEK